ncbi:MAG: class I poly(R)-hydroxyalkanoic acid synthase, partial [Rhodocyclaceae bacterium]|nr:class I poly(R)-hydroxyalkanoic acid synthase [Rhodocyclaceae bacterium]
MQNLFQAGQAFAQGVMNFLAQPSAARSPQAALGAQFAQNEAIASLQKEFAARHAALWQDMLR